MGNKHVSIDYPAGVRFTDFFCPACGEHLMDAEHCAEKPCKHLEWCYIDEAGESAYTSPRIKKLLDRSEGDDELDLALKDAGKSKTTAVICLSGCGVACGPVDTAVWFAIDFMGTQKRAKNAKKVDK